MRLSRREAIVLAGSAAAFAVGLALLVVGVVLVAHRAQSAPLSATAPVSAGAPKGANASGSANVAGWVGGAATVPTLTSMATAPADVPVVEPDPAPASTKPSGPSLDAYHGLGTWVDLYDSRAWANPSAAVADMAAHGVRTLYIETSNYHSSDAIMNPTGLAAFIDQAHARGIRVVAWYLPDLKANSIDYARISRAVSFTTPDGQKFDSFALDIEATVVGSETQRNQNLAALSQQIRALVGPAYPLGAIIPSPVGLAKKSGYWNNFPYASLPQNYDVIVPMAYYTYHAKGAAPVYADASANMRILRAQPNCSAIPVHMIGGIAEKSSAAEVAAFVRATREGGCVGASLYGWPGTSAADWRALQSVPQ